MVYVFHEGFDVIFWIFSVASLSTVCSCIVPLILAMMVMRGFVFHPLFCTVLISGLYLVCLCKRVCLGNLS